MTQQQFDEIIYVPHPLEKIRINQKALLESSPPDLFKFHRLFLNYGNAAYRYTAMATGEIGIEDYEDWLEGLPDDIASDLRRKGFERSKSVMGLRRHALELRDIGMDEFMADMLRPEDLAAWRAESEE